MTMPEEAVRQARETALRKRDEGRYPEPSPGALEHTFVDDVPDIETLSGWATIEVDPGISYSTRRLGGPAVLIKRGLLRLLREYHHESAGQKTRFNRALLGHVRDLEERVARLEHSLRR